MTLNAPILLANSEAPKFHLTHHPSKGTEAWSNPCENLGIVGSEIGSPTVSARIVWALLIYNQEYRILLPVKPRGLGTEYPVADNPGGQPCTEETGMPRPRS